MWKQSCLLGSCRASCRSINPLSCHWWVRGEGLRGRNAKQGFPASRLRYILYPSCRQAIETLKRHQQWDLCVETGKPPLRGRCPLCVFNGLTVMSVGDLLVEKTRISSHLYSASTRGPACLAAAARLDRRRFASPMSGCR